jgi:hypothetical protein
LLDIANTSTSAADGWDGFTNAANGANQGGAKAWTPNILLQMSVQKMMYSREKSYIFSKRR